MSTIAPPIRGKAWVWQVTALCVILGALLALSLKTQRQAMNEGQPTTSTALQLVYRDIKKQNVDLKRELGDYRQRVERMATRPQARDFQRLLEETKMTAGTVAVEGPGIVVVLHDSPKRDPNMSEDVLSSYIVHDRDIREVVNELFAAGAEAISVNNQRLVANSSIRCVGPVVLVNSTQVGAPFIIKAVGKTETLENALKLPMGVADQMFLLDMIEITKQPHIIVPAYNGATRFTSAKPVPQRD